MKKPVNDQIRAILTNHIQQEVDGGVDYEKTRQYYDIRRSNYYYDGEQYLVARWENGAMNWVPASDVITPRSIANNSDELDDSVANVYRGDTRKFVAVIGQKPPNVNCVAASPSDPIHQDRAKTAEFINHHLDGAWDVAYRHMFATHRIAVNSTVFFYTPWRVSQDTYGLQSIPIIEEVTEEVGPGPADCPNCGWQGTTEDLQGSSICPACLAAEVEIGAPLTQTFERDTGQVDKYPRGSVDCQILSSLEVTTPFYIKSLAETPWLRYECEMDRGVVMTYHPEIAEQIRTNTLSGGGMASQGSHIRAQAKSYSKVSLNDMLGKRIRYARYWLRTSQYGLIGAGQTVSIDAGGPQVPVSDWLKQNFPNGLKLCFAGDYLVSYDDERLDDVWSAAQPEPDETMFPKSWMHDMLECQDKINDFFEQADQSIERSLSTTIADPQILDPDLADTVGRRAGQFIWSVPGASGRFSDGFYQLRGSEPRPEIMDHGQRILAQYREITGIVPAIFGGGEGHATLGEAEIDRNQALMVLGLPWFFLRRGWAKAKFNGIRQIAKNSPDGRLYYPVDLDMFGEGVELPPNYKDLLKGGWKCEADEAMPLTAAQIRTWIERMMLSENPDLPNRMGMFHPDNLGRMQDVLGITGWVIPEHKNQQAIIDVIQQLAASEPQIVPDPMTGQEMEVPSIEIDTYLNDPGFTAQAIREWLLSDAGKQLQAKSEAGWRNVWLAGKMLFDQMNAQPAPPADAGEGPPPEQLPPPPQEAPIDQLPLQ